MRRAALAPVLVLAGCGSSAGPIKNVNPTTTTSSSGAKTFSAPGMLLHFEFPAALHTIELSPAKRVVGNYKQSTRAAVGSGPFDLLVVIRYPNRPIPVNIGNLGKLQGGFDSAMTRAFGTPMTGSASTIGGLPALSYATVPSPGLPVQAFSRNTLVFAGDDEYQLTCQYQPAAKASITAACDQMLATLRATK
jgi:hypothetical protein